MTAAAAERQLRREGLASLDYDDGAGGIKVGNRGSGKVLDMARERGRRESAERLQQRKAAIARHLEAHAYPIGDRRRRVLNLYAAGFGNRTIARRTGIGRMSVFRIIAKVEKAMPEQTIAELLHACDPSTLVLFFALVEMALTQPEKARQLVSKARSIPEIRAVLEPDEVR